jgi:hypothetical protein
MNMHISTLTAVGLVLLAQAAPLPAQAKKPTKKAATAPKTAEAGTPALGPIRVPTVVRKASCTLVLKGQLVRMVQAPTEVPTAAPAMKSITEQFEYELPGELEEEVDPLGPVRFKFTPAADLSTNKAAHGRLSLLDEVPGPGQPPVRAEASDLSNAAVFIFEARGRGQGLVPVSGSINLRGRIQSTTPLARPAAPGTDQRPLLSMPLPSLKEQVGRPGTSQMQFQGLAPWAWANTSGPMTISGSINYAGPTAAGRVNGRVEVTFRVGAQVK